ncbi:carbohydrate-binding family 9-like protein [Paraliomyxa miuraensis]|uniref:carbohydrate-binding family 9-like protein n=1 Tax=Paraliomyxa miuraensis TaxID=376150 RepID=UPI002254857A|nr:carbohydrate-binding family 9-like protein [Paraliomyxa miuraensis]MCX4240056.1 carbohydrate-binding family 9-like protein [Paraliomyxa miuraensis]
MAGALALVLTTACGEPVRLPHPIVEAELPAGGWSHAVRFRGGVRIDDVRAPDQVAPGEGLPVSFVVHGPAQGLRARVVAWPPRAGARQVALGGVGAPPVDVPLDPRASVLEVPLTEGTQSLEFTLPRPWFPSQVLVTLELLDGDARIPVEEGPAREDGRAMLALIDVTPRPALVQAVPMSSPPVLDGRLDEPGWAAAVAHPLVHSLDGEPYDERPGTVRLAWDAQALYLGAEIVDPDVWSDLVQHDDPLWNQEVLELFVFGAAKQGELQRGRASRQSGYLELQVSPRGVTFDARFEHHRKGDEAWDGTWRSAVDLRGTLDERRDRDEGWSAELAIPWTEICAHTDVTCPVGAGQTLRINAFRFERPEGRPPVGLALSPPRVPDFHASEHAAVLELVGPS